MNTTITITHPGAGVPGRFVAGIAWTRKQFTTRRDHTRHSGDPDAPHGPRATHPGVVAVWTDPDPDPDTHHNPNHNPRQCRNLMETPCL